MFVLCLLLSMNQGRVILESPMEMQVFQRDGRDRGRIAVRGRLEGRGEILEVRLTGGKAKGEWRPVPFDDRVPGFAATIDAPAGGWYGLEIRLRKGAALVAEGAVKQVGVGELFVVAGQSNAANHAEARLKPATDKVVACDGQAWRVAEDPQLGATGGGGSFIPPLGDILVERLGVPVGFFPVAVGATSVREWVPAGVAFERPPTLTGNIRSVGPGQFESTGRLYQALADRLRLAGPAGVRAILWHQGESDANQKDSNRTLPGGDYRKLMEEIIRASWRDGGRETPGLSPRPPITHRMTKSPTISGWRRNPWAKPWPFPVRTPMPWMATTVTIPAKGFISAPRAKGSTPGYGRKRWVRG